MKSSSNKIANTNSETSYLSLLEEKSSFILKEDGKASVISENLDIKERVKRIVRRIHIKMRIYYIFKKARDVVNQNVSLFTKSNNLE